MSDGASPEEHLRTAGGTCELYRPNGVPHGDEADSLKCVSLPHVGRTQIPPRQWAYGKFLLFGYAAALAAIDGAGKGAIATVMALAMITGRPLLDECIWRKGPVAIITFEDDQDEWHRRIAAACEHYDVDYDFALDNIIFLCKPHNRICFARQGDRGAAESPDGEAIIAELRCIDAVLLIVDPLNHAHGFDDGNNNVAMAKVAAEMNRIAGEARVAVLVLHHLRKGSTGTADDMMGATSLRATFRSSRILSRMTPDEAGKLGITAEPWRHIRISSSKENYSPPPDKATWFKLESVELGNTGVDPTYPDGDQIQVATSWKPPPLFDCITADQMNRIFTMLRDGPGDGWRYSPSKRATRRWAGRVIVEATGKSDEQATAMLECWKDNGVWKAAEYETPERKTAACIKLDEAKVAIILQAVSGAACDLG